jgi:hypothetical protein
MAGVPRRIALQNSKLSGSWQVCVARHCAKPLGVGCNAGRQFAVQAVLVLIWTVCRKIKFRKIWTVDFKIDNKIKSEYVKKMYICSRKIQLE